MKVLALVLGSITLGLIQADVSHLQRDHQRRAGTFIANNGQLVRQSFNSNGDATYSSRTYNGAGNDINPVEHLRQNYFSAMGCSGCMSRAMSIKHNSQYNTQQNAYATNPFTNDRKAPSSFNRISPATVSGSAKEVNDFFEQQQSSSCAEPNSACVSPKFCFNGFINQLDAYKAVRSSVSVVLFQIENFQVESSQFADEQSQPTGNQNKTATRLTPLQKSKTFCFLMSCKAVKGS